jgi:ribosome-binding factor A
MKKLKKADIESVTNELSEGDGIDPREEKKARARLRSAGKPNYAVLRLAGQIRDALNQIIPQVASIQLYSFMVGTVEPSASGGIFVVQIYSADKTADYDPAEIKAEFELIKPRLRAEVAKEVTRKNAPDFKFDILPPGVQPK